MNMKIGLAITFLLLSTFLFLFFYKFSIGDLIVVRCFAFVEFIREEGFVTTIFVKNYTKFHMFISSEAGHYSRKLYKPYFGTFMFKL